MLSKLESKLRRRKKQSDKTAPDHEEFKGDPSEIIDQLRRRMEKISKKTDLKATESHIDVDRYLPGAVCDTSMGEVWLNTVNFSSKYCHGNAPTKDFLNASTGLAALAQDKRIAELSPTKALFFDTETTGLSGGTGTLPFLMGVGWLNDGGDFTVEHLFCRTPEEESAQLELMAAHLERAKYIVTFNGKAFDIPLLNTRFIMNRMSNPGHALPHLDLLHIARRIFGRRLSDRSLTGLEHAVLDFKREGDIPGYAIPEVYARYLRKESAKPIRSVLEHNTLDLLALAALGGVLAEMYKKPEAVKHAADHLGLAKAAWMIGERDNADTHLSLAGQHALGDDRLAALHMTARHALKMKNFDLARDTWLQLLSQYSDDPYAHLALAKHFEHKEKNYVKAAKHARSAVEVEGDDGVEHRLARLKRKMARTKKGKQ